MRMRVFILAAVALAAGGAVFAQTAAVRARDLYYETNGAPNTPETALAPAKRLGVRYSLLKIDPETRRSQLVDPNTNFAAGDCLALEFSPNRDGHLYVFNLQSSGQWQVLLPSLQMPGEASLVKAEKTVRVPQEYCFRLDNPPGVETLLVVVTEREEDVDELQRAVLNSGDQRAAESHVSDDVDRWRKQLAGRDIAVQALGREAARNEEPFSVYVVLTASEANTRIIVEVKIRHE